MQEFDSDEDNKQETLEQSDSNIQLIQTEQYVIIIKKIEPSIWAHLVIDHRHSGDNVDKGSLFSILSFICAFSYMFNGKTFTQYFDNSSLGDHQIQERRAIMRDFMNAFIKELNEISELAWQLGGLMHCPFDQIGYLQSQFFAKFGLKHAAVFWGRFYTGGSIDKIKEMYEYDTFIWNNKRNDWKGSCQEIKENRFHSDLKKFTISQLLYTYVAGLPTCPNNNDIDFLKPIIFNYNRKGQLGNVQLPQQQQKVDDEDQASKLEQQFGLVDKINNINTQERINASQSSSLLTNQIESQQQSKFERIQRNEGYQPKQRLQSMTISCLSDFARIAAKGNTKFKLESLINSLRGSKNGSLKMPSISRGFIIGPVLLPSEPQNLSSKKSYTNELDGQKSIKIYAPIIYLPSGQECRLLVYHYGPLILVMLIDSSPTAPLPALPSMLKFINKYIPPLFYNLTQMLAKMFVQQIDDSIRLVYFNYDNLAVKYTNKPSNKLQMMLDVKDVRISLLNIRAKLRNSSQKYCRIHTLHKKRIELNFNSLIQGYGPFSDNFRVKRAVQKTSQGFLVGIRWQSRQLYYLSTASDLQKVYNQINKILDTILQRFLILNR